MDAAKVEDYARLQAKVTVTDKKNRVLWNDVVMATVTQKPMSKIESATLVAKDFAKVFIKQCFSKRR